jgi:hypothetical protein
MIAPIARTETRVPGGVVITVQTIGGRRFRALNDIGVMLRDGLSVIDFASFADAEAALRSFSSGDDLPPPKVERCRHCRASHPSDSCPVHADAERVRERRRSQRDGGAPTTMTTTPTLSDYLSAIARIDGGTGRGANVHDVKRAVWGSSTGMTDTRLAIDELVESGSVERVAGKVVRFRPTALGVRVDSMAAPKPLRAFATVFDLPDVHAPNGSRVLVAEKPPSPPEVLEPEDPAECASVDEAIQAERGDDRCPNCEQAPRECRCEGEPEFTEAEIREHLPDGGAEHDDGPLYDPAAESTSWVRAVAVIKRERHLHETLEHRIAELRQAETDFRAMADEARCLREELGG